MKTKKISQLLCSTLITTFMITNKVQAASPKVIRMSGLDRYETNLSIVKNGWIESPTVIIANGENYPDALCATPLAKSKNAPIILTSKEKLNNSTLEELSKLKTKDAYIIGGTGVISDNVENQLNELGITCIRLAGQDRFETSVKVAEQLTTENGIVVASGENFPDALSIAPIAAKMGMPILLSSKSSLPSKVNAYLQDKNTPISYIIGGVGVLGAGVKASLNNPKRLSGMDRYETNISIMKEFKSILDFTSIFVASGNNFPDALSGSVLASNYNAPIILTGNSLSEVTSGFLENQNCKTLNLLGGTGAINRNTENNLKSMMNFLNIIKVDNMSDFAYMDEDYNFPPVVLATFEDSSTKLVPVKWNSTKVDTSKASSYKFEGTVIGYDGKVQLHLDVVEDTDSSNGNLGNGSRIAYYKGYLYYASYKDGNVIYRLKNGEMTKISYDFAADLNITNDLVYYRNVNYGEINSMNLDGSNNRKAVDDKDISAFIVVNNCIYYSKKGKGISGFYKVNTDGTDKIKLSDDDAYYLNIVDDYIYYSNGNDNNSIYKMKIDGTERTKLNSDSSAYLNIVGNWIYYAAEDGTFTEKGPGYKIYKVKTDGTERTKISDDFPNQMKVHEGWIYYSSRFEGEKIYKMRLDGSQKTQLTDIRASIGSIIGDYIFYQAWDYNDAHFIMRLDGSLNERFAVKFIDEKESNNTLSTALEVTPVQGFGDAYSIIGHLGKTDEDFFKIKTSYPFYLNVVFSSPSIGRNAVVTLLDINGNEIYSTKTRYDGVASFTVEMESGSACYIKVSSPQGELIESGTYELVTWFTSLW